MPLYAYRCASGHTTDLLRGRDVTEDACACGLPAQRVTFYAVSIGGQPEQRYRLSEYIEADGELKHAAARAGVEPPNLWAAGNHRAAAAKRAGVRP